MDVIIPFKHVNIMNGIKLMVPSEHANVALAPSPIETGTIIRDCTDPNLSLETTRTRGKTKKKTAQKINTRLTKHFFYTCTECHHVKQTNKTKQNGFYVSVGSD